MKSLDVYEIWMLLWIILLVTGLLLFMMFPVGDILAVFLMFSSTALLAAILEYKQWR